MGIVVVGNVFVMNLLKYLWFLIYKDNIFRENYQCVQGKAMATLD